jgi:hypothetical protein
LANGLRPPGFAPLVALQVIPALGATIAPNINTSGLTHQTILQLVQFYNDHFGIQLGDMVPIRSQKIVNWLTTDI